jgi:hypothetical protein
MMPRDIGPLVGKLLMANKSVVLLLSDQHVYILAINDALNDHHIVDVVTKECFSYNTIDSTGPAFFQGRITKKTSFVAYLIEAPGALAPQITATVETTPVPVVVVESAPNPVQVETTPVSTSAKALQVPSVAKSTPTSTAAPAAQDDSAAVKKKRIVKKPKVEEEEEKIE